MDLNFKPSLRYPIDFRFQQIGTQGALVLRCPLGITKKPLLLVPAVAPLLSCFNGTMTAEEIAAKFAQNGATTQIVRQLISLLDEHLFLDTERFQNAYKQAKKDFEESLVRKPALAGATYSADKELLQKEISSYLEEWYKKDNIPKEKNLKPENLVCLVSPHIDYFRGHKTYGAAYANINCGENDLIILIGTAHQYSPRLFHLCSKDFATPLGIIKTDKEFTDSLASFFGKERAFADQFLHKEEHSLELQTPFCPKAKIVPILVGSFHNMIVQEKYPEEFEEYESFAFSLVSALTNELKHGRRVVVVAGVDMAHIGREFGDPFELTDEFMASIKERDKVYLEAILQCDKKKLFNHIAEDKDKRRICGFPTMYLVLDVFQRLQWKVKGKIFEYRQAVNRERTCGVTFAAVGLYRTAL